MKGIIVVDWQQEYIDDKSDYYVGSSLREETNKLNNLLTKFRKNNSLIIFIKHNEQSGRDFLKGSADTNLIGRVNVTSTDVLIDKYHISAFYGTNLDKILKKNQIKEIYICGILTNLCVRSVISDAYDREYRINVISDLCISFTKEIQDFTLKDIKDTRPEINILRSSEL